MTTRSISVTQVLVLIFDSKLSVTEHNRIQLFIKYDRLRGRSFLIDRCTSRPYTDALIYTRKRVCFTYFVDGRKVGTHFQSYRMVLVNIGEKTRVITCLLEEHTFYKRCLQVSTAFTPAMFNIG